MGASLAGVASTSQSINQGPSTIRYFPIASVEPARTTSEANANSPWPVASSFSQLFVRVSANTLTTSTTTVRLRINGVGGNLRLTIPAGSTGVFTDTTHSDAIPAGAAVDFIVSTSAGASGVIRVNIISVNVLSDVDFIGQQGNFVTFPITVNSNAITRFVGLPGQLNYSSDLLSSSSSEIRTDVAGKFRYLTVLVTSNARTTDTIVKSRVNNADGNQTITIPAGATGWFQDTTHTDTLSAGDSYGAAVQFGASAEAFAIMSVQGTFINSQTKQANVYCARMYNGQERVASATTNYTPIFGSLDDLSLTNETIMQGQLGFDAIASKLVVKVLTNNCTGDVTVRLRVNGANGNQVVTIPAGVTGYLQDTTHSDTLSPTDNVNYSIVGGTSASLFVMYIGMLLTTIGPNVGQAYII